MGCFSSCFGSSKDRRRRRNQGSKVLPRDQKTISYKPVQPPVCSNENTVELPISATTVSELQDKPAEQVSTATKRKVTFNSIVKTYEHVPDHEKTILSAESGRNSEKGEEKVLAKPTQSRFQLDENSFASNSGLHPLNYRYHNCRDSDEEVEDMDFDQSDLDDEEEEKDDDDDFDELECGNEGFEDRASISDWKDDKVPSLMDSVLNPIENLAQWKAIKGRGKPILKHQKENLSSELEPHFKHISSFSFESKRKHPKNSNQEISVDASLSNWLAPSSETSSITGKVASETPPPKNCSPKDFEDRPILGALTMEELKQISASSSPRKSPCHSPDDMPIIGSVGSYWSRENSNKEWSSISSYKGIPNTTSKYTEDRSVIWHSTPFETRLERALKGGDAGEACFKA